MEQIDITIIGAGVIGLAAANEVAAPGTDIFILEKNDSFGRETSSRNSEVIHAGIYYPAGSLKSASCVEGRKMLYSLCKEKGIAHKKIGKLIVALNKGEITYLEELQKKAAKNGVDLRFLEPAEIKNMEPNAVCLAALFSPETGIIDSHSLMKYFLESARLKGAEPVFNAEVTGIQKVNGGFILTVDNQGEHIEIKSRVVINCAGNNADKIAAMAGIDIDALGYRQYYLKGNYFRLSDEYRNITSHLIYPVPNANSLGIHTVLDLSGGIRLGPDEEEIDQFDYKVNEARKDAFYESVKQFLPCVKEGSLYPDMSGIRPQLKEPNSNGFKDFIISDETSKGLPGLINLVGMESPGLTASPYIALKVKHLVESVL